MTPEVEFLTKSKFTKLIEKSVIDKRHSYIDAVVDLCEGMKMDPADVKKFISPVIEDKIEAEARRLNYLPRGNMLPVD
jgi:hypothetical protein|tara:strand:- start:209 stop:442 length:234 start_codon:yes stop_codon:yes gene_type:complete